jgi:hypothetical protein
MFDLANSASITSPDFPQDNQILASQVKPEFETNLKSVRGIVLLIASRS